MVERVRERRKCGGVRESGQEVRSGGTRGHDDVKGNLSLVCLGETSQLLI